MGLTHEVAHGSLRLSLGQANTQEDVDYCLEVLPEIIGRLRSMSPLSAASKMREEKSLQYLPSALRRNFINGFLGK